jgi:hypothetical protein
MDMTQRRRLSRRVAVGGALALAVAFAVVGSGLAAATAKPSNSTAPKVIGAARVGQVLTGDRGTWTNSPTSYAYSWLRCNTGGGGCDAIGGANGTTYTLAAADDGHTVRFRVTATNADGSTTATSAPTAVVVASGKPANTSAPTISGVAQDRQTLKGGNGSWTNSPTSYTYAWLRCDKQGGSCATINGANKSTYTLTTADVGNTVRFRVTASNSAGNDTAASAASAVISAFRGDGCPVVGNPDQIASLNSPARLLVDSFQSDPAVVGKSTGTVVLRFHVTSTCGGPVQGALVYATAIPYNQFAIPPEASSGADGWATLTFQRVRGFPVSKRQQLLAVFVRVRKGGENVLTGIGSRRLVSVRVNLKSS